MTDLVEAVLKELGPCVSGQVVDALVSQHGLSNAAARQRLFRNQNIKRLAFLPFPRNARFVYLQGDYRSPTFWHALASALLENTIAHGGALASLLARGGAMPLAHFAIACGAPIAQKKHLSPASILDRLQQADLVQLEEVPGIGVCVKLSQQIYFEAQEITRFHARLLTEEILLLAVKDWVRKLGMVSYDKVKLRTNDDGEQPKVGTFNWDLTGPCYLAPMIKWSAGKPQPGFVVCDVLLERHIQPLDLQPFLTKCQTLRNLKGVNRCLQIFVAEGYTPEALRMAKADGIIPATPESLFGEEVGDAFRQLTSVLNDAFGHATNPEQLNEIFRRLSRIEGAATNLRGTLFEYLVAELVRRTSVVDDLRMNEIFRSDEGKSAEVDVFITRRGHSNRFVECKGYKAGGIIPDELVERWLKDRIPLIRKEAMSNRFWRGHALIFEFWTTGVLSEVAIEMVERARPASAGKYTIEISDQSRIQKIVKAIGDKALQATFDEHFFEHPLQTVQRDIDRRAHHSRLRSRGKLKEL